MAWTTRVSTQTEVNNFTETSVWFDVCLSVHHMCIENKNQLEATECFIALIICLTCFGHYYAHHQELKTVCVLLLPMVCNALVAGCRGSGAWQPTVCSGLGMLLATSLILDAKSAALHLTSDNQQPRHCTPQAAITHIVSSSWWWA